MTFFLFIIIKRYVWWKRICKNNLLKLKSADFFKIKHFCENKWFCDSFFVINQIYWIKRKLWWTEFVIQKILWYNVFKSQFVFNTIFVFFSKFCLSQKNITKPFVITKNGYLKKSAEFNFNNFFAQILFHHTNLFQYIFFFFHHN